MKILSDDVLMIVVRKNNKPIAIIQNDSQKTGNGIDTVIVMNNELARKHINDLLDTYPLESE